MSMWTAASDVDHDFECGNGDRWDRVEDDEPEESPEDIDPETEHWLETHGYFDAPSDADIDHMYVDAVCDASADAMSRVYDAIAHFADVHRMTFRDAVECIRDAEGV